MVYLDNVPGTLPHAMGYGDNSDCPECLTATEIMLERCPQQSIALALTTQSASFGKDGKVIITDEHFDSLRQFSLNGKITPGNHRKNRSKEGIRKIFYDAVESDVVDKHYSAQDCNAGADTRRMSNFSDQFAGLMDQYTFQSHLCGAASVNACNPCAGGAFSDIGSEASPFEIEIDNGSQYRSAMQMASEQFIQFLINMKAYGDNLPDNCSSQMYVVMNSCMAPLMAYMDNASKAVCDSNCALSDGLFPMSNNSGMLPHVYFSKRIPMTSINGVKSSPVIAGYYGDDILRPEPVFIERNVRGKHTSSWDYTFYSFQYANVRPDRKWVGHLQVKGV